jgi:hypothetical protein
MSLFQPPGLTKPRLGAHINWGNRLTEGLVGCWLLNEESGTTCFDLTQQYGNGTIQGGANWQYEGGALVRVLNSSSQYIQVPNNPAFNIFTALGYSALIRFRLRTLRNYNGLIAYESGGNLPLDSYVPASGDLTVPSIGGSPTIAGLVAGQWYTFVHTYVRGTTGIVGRWELWLNGVLRNSANFADAAGNVTSETGSSWRFGNRSDNVTVADMDIDYAMIWYRPLTPDQVVSLYASPFQFIGGQGKRNFVVFQPTSINLTFSDGLSFTDTLGPERSDALSIADALTLSDSSQVILPFVQELSDTLALTDSQAQALTTLLYTTLGDTLALTDAVNLLVAISAIIGDSLVFSDSLLTVISNFINAELDDSLLLTDGVLVQLIRVFLFGDQLTLTDTVELVNALRISVSDSLSLSDSVSGTQPPAVLSVTVSDAIALSDAAAVTTADYIVSYLRRYLNDVPRGA